MNKKIVALVALLVIGFLPQGAHAQWADPTQSPPNGNASSPLNVSGTAQTKAGGLILNSGAATNGLLVQYGNVGIGTLSPLAKLDVNGNFRQTLAHGNNSVIILPAANNGGGTGDAGLYTWISEPYSTWTGAGIGRNMSNTNGSFPRVNGALSGQMMRFDEGTGILFTSETSGGTRYNPFYLTANNAIFNGNVGIGNGSPQARLHVTGNAILGGGNIGAGTGNENLSYLNNTGQMLIGWNKSGGSGETDFVANQGPGSPGGFNFYNHSNGGTDSLLMSISGNGTVSSGAFYYSSDRNLKTNIQPLSNSLENVLKLQGVSFNWKKDGTADVGVIAQDVEKVYPELVHTDKTTGLKSVEYGNLVGPLIEAVKAQQKEIDALKAEVSALKAGK